jgi:hypothetical protein
MSDLIRFKKLDIVIEDWIINDLIHDCFDLFEDFENYTSNNRFVFPYKLIGTKNVLEKGKAIRCLYDLFETEPVTDCILYIPPLCGTDIHIDTHADGKRQTVMSLPLVPDLSKYEPTYFYENGKVVEVCKYEGSPVMLNTSVEHEVRPSPYHRFCFQLCFDKPINEVKLKVENK